MPTSISQPLLGDTPQISGNFIIFYFLISILLDSIQTFEESKFHKFVQSKDKIQNRKSTGK